MQWEYCSLTWTSSGLYSETGAHPGHLIYYGRSTPISRRVNYEEAIAKLGIAGWELVGVDEGRLYLKRPIQPMRAIHDAL